MKDFFSNGKILLTGEYLVLRGARALALPLQIGQSLSFDIVAEAEEMIDWTAYKPDGVWFSARLSKNGFSVVDATDMAKAEMLRKIFVETQRLNPHVFAPKGKFVFSTKLGFDPSWGFGSSSTLISNMAQWAGVDPYALLAATFGGSGYDIACATAGQPVFYSLLEGGGRCVDECGFAPSFSNDLWLVYQGHKKNSAEAVKAFGAMRTSSEDVERISKISLDVAQTNSFDEFCGLMELHEDIVGRTIGCKPLKHCYPDFDGHLKSLGAWGGDFILAATRSGAEYVSDYFGSHGLDTIIQYDNLIRYDR